MNTGKTFDFNGVTYDTKRFTLAQMLFTKVVLKEKPVVGDVNKPLISDEFAIPVVTTIEGVMIVMACNQAYLNNYLDKAVVNYLLVTKVKLKSYVFVPYTPPVYEPRAEWRPQPRTFQRPYQDQGRNDYNNRY